MGPKQGLPSATEHAKLRTFLQNKGLAVPQIAALIGNAPGLLTRRGIEQALTTWLKQRPKG